MTVRVEFYGIPRQRAGVEALEVEAATLGEVFTQLQRQLPALAADCFDEGRLAAGCIANINGRQFTRDANFPLQAGDAVLLLSADAGG